MEKIHFCLDDKGKQERVEKVLVPLHISNDRANMIDEIFMRELETGMKHGLEASSLQMENTYVPELMNGHEEGRYLALDLGKSFRITFYRSTQTYSTCCYFFQEEQTSGSSSWNWLAEKLSVRRLLITQWKKQSDSDQEQNYSTSLLNVSMTL